MKVAIVEDEFQHAELLRSHVIKYCREHNEKVDVVCFNDGIDIVSEYSGDYDVIFLDVEMKHMDGLTTAARIREMDNVVMIYFVSAAAQYAIDGYEYDAAGYMLKPVEYAEFARKFERAVRMTREQSGDFIAIFTESGVDRVACDDIIYIESQNHIMNIHTKTKEYRIYDTMRRLADALPSDRFLRCNNCYLVNISYINGIRGEFVSVGDTELKISRSRRKEVVSALSQVFGTI